MRDRRHPQAGTVVDVVHGIIARHRADATELLQILREVQATFTYIPLEAARAIAASLWMPLTEVQGVIDFYTFLYDQPRGQYHLLVSDCILDELRGSDRLTERLCRRLDVPLGTTRVDGRVSVALTSCTGLCDQGPALLVNGYAMPALGPERIEAMRGLIEEGVPLSQWPPAWFHIEEGVRRRDRLLSTALPAGAALRAVIERGNRAILDVLECSGLRGLGGAGYPTGPKWRASAGAAAAQRFVVCNADEGEPGTFKDRLLLQRYGDLVFEGMTLCARAIGAQRGFLYLRGEYLCLLEGLESLLEHRRRAGLLGRNILGMPGFDFDIDIHVGAGAYICGEESALLESLEGKRGVPRKRPPFPVTHGYRQCPTVVNNVETFAQAAHIAVHGAEWFRQRGTPQSPGTKLISVSGDCARPGIYEYPFGISVAQVLEDCGASAPQAVQVSGAAGRCVAASEFERRLAFEDLATGGAFMIFGPERDLLAVVRNFARFFAHESCGFCVPCRVGTSLFKDVIDKIYRGHGSELDVKELRRLAHLLQQTSHCGLGHTAPNAVLDTLEKFPGLWRDRLRVASFEPAFDLDGALAPARQLTGRDDRQAHL
ncbi:MAG: NAD(P)H-dependent oxidoreductase subunit E [Gammaproteobacteria bacterium]